MKKFFLLLLLCAVSIPAFCQTDAVVAAAPLTFFETIKAVFLPAIIAQLLVLFADAKKYYGSPDWSWGSFFSSKIRPFLYTTLGGMSLFILFTYLPATKQFIEAWTGSPIVELTSAALFGTAAALINGFSKPTKA